MLDSRMVSMGVLSNDFAAVDLREELCYHSLTEKANSRGAINGKKPMIESHARRKKRQPIPKAVQRGRLRVAALSVGFPRCSCCLSVACAWLRRASARRTCLCQAHATVPTVTFLAMSEERNHILSCSIFSKLRCKIRICLRQSGDRRK